MALKLKKMKNGYIVPQQKVIYLGVQQTLLHISQENEPLTPGTSFEGQEEVKEERWGYVNWESWK